MQPKKTPDPLSHLAHPKTPRDPNEQRASFTQNVEHPAQAWKNQQKSLVQWALQPIEKQLKNHRLETSPHNKAIKRIAHTVQSVFNRKNS